MFKEWPRLSTTTNKPRQQLHITGLIYVADACVQQGINAAQGLRLAKRHFPKIYATMKIAPNKARASDLARRIKTIISQNMSVKIKSMPMAAPNHFVLRTIIPTGLNKHQGYMLPSKDVHPDVHFVRTQRRYNKRRYARVRAVSRPSFWAGMMLSTLMTGAFWGAAGKLTNWFIGLVLLTDINHWIIGGYILLLYRVIHLAQSSNVPYARELNSIKPRWFKRFRSNRL